MKFWLVIPAAGIGSRMASDCPKQYLQIAGKTILEHSLQPFLQHPGLRKAVVAIAEHDSYWPNLALANNSSVHQVRGGVERADSVLNALQALPQLGAAEQDWVLVHDAARPWLQSSDLDKLLNSLAYDLVGGLLAYPARDTLKLADGAFKVTQTMPRTQIWHALTPQMFRLGQLTGALERALSAKIAITDEASAMEWAGRQPQLVHGRSDNIKVTYPEDFAVVSALLNNLDGSR